MHRSTSQSSRRDLLGAAVAAAAAWGIADRAARSEPANSDGPDDLIDAHVHVWSPDTARYPLAHGYTKEQMAIPRLDFLTPTDREWLLRRTAEQTFLITGRFPSEVGGGEARP